MQKQTDSSPTKTPPPAGAPVKMITEVIQYAIGQTEQKGIEDLLVFLRNLFEKGDTYLKDRLKDVSETDKEAAVTTKQRTYSRGYVGKRLAELKKEADKAK